MNLEKNYRTNPKTVVIMETLPFNKDTFQRGTLNIAIEM